MPKKILLDSAVKLQTLLEVLEDKKSVDPQSIDLRGKVTLTDFLLICTGTSNIHIRSLCNYVLERIEEDNWSKPKIEGYDGQAEWVLMDFGDVVLHIMSPEARARFKLEQFWTTTQPKGAIPPTPEALTDGAYGGAQEEMDWDENEGDDDEADIAFFKSADTEVEPIDDTENDL
jgi:ribosome-associated protein